MDGMGLLTLCAVLCGIITVLYPLAKWNIIKSNLDNIPGPPSQSYITGNMSQYRGPDALKFVYSLNHYYGELVVKLHGLFNRPILYVFDPKALHTVLIKDDGIWEQPPSFLALNLGLFGPGLLATHGERHRKQRNLLNPIFTTAHMRYMLPIFQHTVERLRGALEDRVMNGAQELDMANWMGRTALELIGQGGFGHSLDPLVEDATDNLAISLKLFFPIVSRLGVLVLLLPYVRAIVPASLRGLASFLPVHAARDMKYHADLVTHKARELYQSKKRALEDGSKDAILQDDEAQDLLSIILRANLRSSKDEAMLEEELVAQISTIVFAAMDTTSNTLARILLCLAEHPKVQQRLRSEITDAFHEGDIDFDTLMGLPYLAAVCRETLRLHPHQLWTGRIATRDTVLPLSRPIHGKDGKLVTELVVAAGTEVYTGILGCNTSKELWGEDALEWKPDRWLSPLPDSIAKAGMPGLVGPLMTFLNGRHGCIGFRFAELEMKTVLAVLLQRFTFEPSDHEIHWIPSPVIYPTVGQDRQRAQLPIRVGLYKGQ